MAITGNKLFGQTIDEFVGRNSNWLPKEEVLAQDGLPTGERDDGFYYLRTGRFRVKDCDIYGRASETMFTVKDGQFEEFNLNEVTIILSPDGERMYLKSHSLWDFLKAKLWR